MDRSPRTTPTNSTRTSQEHRRTETPVQDPRSLPPEAAWRSGSDQRQGTPVAKRVVPNDTSSEHVDTTDTDTSDSIVSDDSDTELPRITLQEAVEKMKARTLDPRKSLLVNAQAIVSGKAKLDVTSAEELVELKERVTPVEAERRANLIWRVIGRAACATPFIVSGRGDGRLRARCDRKAIGSRVGSDRGGLRGRYQRLVSL